MCDFPDKFHIGIVEQDVKVLDGMDGLEGLPILKPNDLHSTVNWGQRLACQPTKIWKQGTHPLRRQLSAKLLLHIVVNIFPSSIGEVTGGWVLCQRKFGPNHYMDDALLHAIRPVVQQDLKILWIGLVRTSSLLESAGSNSASYYPPSNSNGRPFGFKSSSVPSPQHSLFLTTKLITDPYFFLV